MIYRAYSSYSAELLSFPETGMGYQIIDSRRANSNILERFVVFNSELIVPLDNMFLDSKRQLIREGFKNTLNTVSYLNLVGLSFVNKRMIQQLSTLAESKRNSTGRHTGGKGAMDSPKENATGDEKFVRLSVYEDDKRVDVIYKKFKPGTFATTDIDYVTCKVYKDDPIDRYALPNDEPIKWAFYCKPVKTDQLQRGIVQPAFGHDGGGLEVYFDDGTSNNTYFQKSQY